METADVVIVGGGVIGTSIAYRLAGNRKVVLIEKGEIGAETSGSCDKAIFLQSKKPGFPIKLAQESRMVYENLEEELGMNIEFQKNGGMIVIENESHLDFMRKFVKQQNKAGIGKLSVVSCKIKKPNCFQGKSNRSMYFSYHHNFPPNWHH